MTSNKDEENFNHIPPDMKQKDIGPLVQNHLNNFLTHISPYFDSLSDSKKIHQTRLLLSDIEYLKIENCDNICGAIFEALTNSILETLHNRSAVDIRTLRLTELPPFDPKTPLFSAQFPELDAAIKEYHLRQDEENSSHHSLNR